MREMSDRRVVLVSADPGAQPDPLVMSVEDAERCMEEARKLGRFYHRDEWSREAYRCFKVSWCAVARFEGECVVPDPEATA